MPSRIDPSAQIRRRPAQERVPERAPIHEGAEAAEYSRLIERWGWLLNQPFVNFLSKLGLEQGRVLDIGTGPGRIAVDLAKRHPGWKVWALDASRDMLAAAGGEVQRQGLGGRVRLVHGSAERLPFPDGFFDLVYSNLTLHHLDHPGAFFDEAARVTRGGGRVVVKDLCRPSPLRRALLLSLSRRVLRYSPRQMELYRDSLRAAFTPEEVRAALRHSRLCLAQVRGFQGLDFLIMG